MFTVVLTGGPCAGKSTVLERIKVRYGELVQVVPEAATLLLAGGFPVPGRDVEWSQQWQRAFQSAILPLQRSLEDTYSLMAEAKGSKLLVCDRGTLDGAAYTPGGQEVFCRHMGLEIEDELDRYRAIVHLESLATADPEAYGTTGNASRFESLEEATRLEYATREAWHGHPSTDLVSGYNQLDDKVARACTILDRLLGFAELGY